jgi:hypothetical protein
MSKCKPLSAYLCPCPSKPVTVASACGGFSLGASEQALFDCITSEHVNITGTTITYWPQDQSRSIVDPVYNEPVKRAWAGPYTLKGMFAYPNKSTGVAQEGLSSQVDTTLWIPRVEVERVGMKAPSESDVLQVWNTPYWNIEFAVDGYNVPGAGLFFAVTDVREDGVLFDNPVFVGFELTLRRNTQQTPERKLVTSI